MLPLLEAELIERKGWLSEDEIMDYYSIGQCTPGIIAVNVSTFTGYKLAGFFGAIFATAGLVCPSLVIITVLANILDLVFANEYVMHAFTGIRIVVIALMCDVVINMCRRNITDWFQWVIFAAIVGLMIYMTISPVWVVIGSAILGIILRRGAE